MESINWIIQILSGAIGTAAFGILFNIRGKKLLFAGLGGAISQTLYLLLSLIIINEIGVYLLVSVSMTVYSEILAYKLKTPTTTFLIVSLIPLIPGGSLYYSLSSAFQGNTEEFFSRALRTFQLAAALSIGIILVLSVTQYLKRSAVSSKKHSS